MTRYSNITEGKKSKLENRLTKKARLVEISSVVDSESETEREKSRSRSETPEIPTQALLEDEIQLQKDKKIATKKITMEQRQKKFDKHPIAEMIHDLIAFTETGLAPLPRVMERVQVGSKYMS